MRVLIAVEPLMYREVFALAIHSRRPDIEVLAAPSASPDGRVESFAPHLLVRGGAGMHRLEGAPFWVELLYGDSLDARINLDGEVREVKDISTDDLIGITEETERLVPGPIGEYGTPVGKERGPESSRERPISWLPQSRHE